MKNIDLLRRLAVATAVSTALLAGCASFGPTEELRLTGDQEVPPVRTDAIGRGQITVSAEGAVAGSIQVTGVPVTMAHIHVGASGSNGPVIVPLARTGEGVWSVPPGTRLTPEQLARYQAGELYVNVHTAANPGGEVRAQLKRPPPAAR